MVWWWLGGGCGEVGGGGGLGQLSQSELISVSVFGVILMILWRDCYRSCDYVM